MGVPKSSVRPNNDVASRSAADTTTRGLRSSHNARASRSDSAAWVCRTWRGCGNTARKISSVPAVIRIRLRTPEKDIVTVYSLMVISPADHRKPVGNRRGRSCRRHRFRSKRKFLDTHIRHSHPRCLGEPVPPGPNMVAMIEAAFLTALVTCIGSAPGTSSPCLLAIRTVDLSAKVPTTDEEDAPAKFASQLIQGNFVFHPPCGRKESGRPELPALSSPIVKLHPPDRGPRALTLGPHPSSAAALYPGFAAVANFASRQPLATTRRSDFLGSSWPPTRLECPTERVGWRRDSRAEEPVSTTRRSPPHCSPAEVAFSSASHRRHQPSGAVGARAVAEERPTAGAWRSGSSWRGPRS